ncbi:FAD-dependent oxidoreductase [Clostridium sp. KNHs205]|uniref:FAD-dependent oxidoreductase n=1 Tax=Clostridium sp. KNHs205 TaxID=1449050 RepID=UPI00051B08D8|nr:FAD-dependent oxidoreductase [Clostridium sp. KNHs205]
MNIRFSQEIPINEQYEVIVAGGGPSGCAAAIAAAREGARVLLIEVANALGGMGTSGLVPAWCPFSDRTKVVYRGIALEVFERAKSGMRHVGEEDLDWVPIDPEALKRVYDEMVVDAGVTVLFSTQVIAAPKTQKKIDYLVTANKAGITAYKGKVYIDGTGDADIAAMAGLDFEIGEEGSHKVQPSTHCFMITNVDDYYYRNSPFLHMQNPDCAAYDIARSEKYPLVTDPHCCNSVIGPGAVGFNAGHIWEVDGTEPFSVSKALIKGRQLAYQYHQGLKEYLPEVFGGSFLAATASSMGIRESRRIIGEYKLTLTDYKERRSFPDEIGRNCYFLDVHHGLEERESILKGEKNGEEGWEAYGDGESHGIPYRSLIPKNIENLLVAGRTIACEHIIQGSIRVMPVCMVTGQAAGTAARLAARNGDMDVRAVDIRELREILKRNGAFLK